MLYNLACNCTIIPEKIHIFAKGSRWLSVNVLYSRMRGYRFKPHWNLWVVSLNKTHFILCFVLAQPSPDMTEKLLTGTLRIKSNKQNDFALLEKQVRETYV